MGGVLPDGSKRKGWRSNYKKEKCGTPRSCTEKPLAWFFSTTLQDVVSPKSCKFVSCPVVVADDDTL